MLNPRIDWNPMGKTVIVTGASSGIGKATALELAKMGVRRLILACRNVAAGEETAVDIRERAGGLAPDVVAVRHLDLASFESIRKFAHDIIAEEPYLHILINNAGCYAGDKSSPSAASTVASSNSPRQLSAEGYELTFAVNHLGSYLLTLLLLDLLKRSSPSRIVNVTAGNFFFKLCNRSKGFLNNDPNFAVRPQTYTPLQAYCQSKLANVYFTRALHRLLRCQQTEADNNISTNLPPLQLTMPLALNNSASASSANNNKKQSAEPTLSKTSSTATLSPVMSDRSGHLNDDPGMGRKGSTATLASKASEKALSDKGNNNDHNEEDDFIDDLARIAAIKGASVLSKQQQPKRPSLVKSSSASSNMSSPANSIEDRTRAASVKKATAIAPSTPKSNKTPAKRVSIASSTAKVTVATAAAAVATTIFSPGVADDSSAADRLASIAGGFTRITTVVSVFAVCPGTFLRTDLDRNISRKRLTRFMLRPFYKSADQGAIMVVYCASAPNIETLSGSYFAKCRPVEPLPIATNDMMTERLWQLSAKLVDNALMPSSSSNRRMSRRSSKLI